MNLSSGNPFLDNILQGGFQIGSTILFTEDFPSKLSEIFFKYSISESLINNHFILYYSQSKNSLKLFYKSTQIENILNSKNIQKEEMKIAWRYENINYYNLIKEFNKNLKYIFDISREIQENLYNKNQIKIEKINYENLNDFMNIIIKDINNIEENNNKKNNIIKIFIDDFLEFVNDFNYNEIKTFLINLKCIGKCLNGNIFININSNFNKKILNLIKEFTDYNFYIKPLFFLSEKEKISDYDAIFSIKKLPRINNLNNNNINIECDNFGIIKDKRKIIIEKIDIGVEIDRNTKIKEFEIKNKLDF